MSFSLAFRDASNETSQEPPTNDSSAPSTCDSGTPSRSQTNGTDRTNDSVQGAYGKLPPNGVDPDRMIAPLEPKMKENCNAEEKRATLLKWKAQIDTYVNNLVKLLTGRVKSRYTSATTPEDSCFLYYFLGTVPKEIEGIEGLIAEFESHVNEYSSLSSMTRSWDWTPKLTKAKADLIQLHGGRSDMPSLPKWDEE